MRTRTLLLLAGVVLVAVVATACASGGVVTSRRAPQGTDTPEAASQRAGEVLRAWDRRRAVAWADGDIAGLAGLYTPKSRTGAHDVADLRRWRARGLRVVGLRQQVVALRVLVERPRWLVVRVTDRTVDGVAVGDRRTALPTSAWANHRIRLRLVHGRWLVDEVAAQPAR